MQRRREWVSERGQREGQIENASASAHGREAGRGRTEPEHTESAPNTVISAARARVFERGTQSESQSKVIEEVERRN